VESVERRLWCAPVKGAVLHRAYPTAAMALPSGARHERAMDALGQRIAASWTEIRRGAATSEVRACLHGPGAARLDRGQMDPLALLAPQPLWRMSELAEALRVDPST